MPTRIGSKLPQVAETTRELLSKPAEALKAAVEELPKIAAKVSDAFDEAVGLDHAGPKPVTLTGVTEAHFRAMEPKVQAMEVRGAAIDEETRKRLEAGEIVSTWKTNADGSTEHLTRVLPDIRLDDFLFKMPLKEWSKHLAGYKGGEVKEFAPRKYLDRMVIRMPGADLDMTKIETHSLDADRQGHVVAARVRWEVLKTDNGTCPMDVGYLKLEKYGDKTLVTFNSAHKLNKFPALIAIAPKAAREAATGLMLSETFKGHAEAYRKFLLG